MSTAPDEPWSNAPGWHAFFDLLADAVVLFDARGRVAIANTAALRLLPFEVGMQPDALRPVIGVDASAWLKRTVTRGAVAEPPPAARLADGRSAALTWQRLDARHSVLRIVPDPIPPARATTLPAVGGAGVRETLSLFWESPFPASLQGADFRMLDVNQALLDYTGYTREQLIGQDPRTLQPDDDHLLNDAARERLRASFGHAREPALQAGRLIDASGRERHYRVARRALQGDDGEPLYLAVLQDATAEHVARERADRSLRELDDWFDLNPVGMVLFDDTGLLLRTNPIFDALTGVVPVALSDAPAGLQQLLAWGGTAVLPQLTPGGAALQREGSVSGARGEEQPLRSVVRCYLAAGGQRRYMAVLEDRSAEEERDLAQMQIGALMDTAGVGLATFEVSSGWVRHGRRARGDPAASAALQSISREIVAPESLAEYERLQKALRQAERAEVRYAIEHPELGRRWLLTRVEPATLASGKRTTSVVTLDITEQHQSTLRNEQLVQELSTILESTMAGIAFIRGQRIQRANQALAQLAGRSVGELELLDMAELFPDRVEFERCWALQERELRSQGRWTGERQLRQRDGRLRWVQVAKQLVTPGDLAGGIIASYIDVDARRSAERAVALQAERTRSILDSVLVGIVTVGPQGIEWMNRSARRMFGGALADFVNLPISTVATPEPDHPFRRTQYLTELIEGQAQTFECRVLARDGREFWVVGNAVSTERESSGRQLTYALLDIERRRLAEARVSEAQASLQRIIEAAPLAITLYDAHTLGILQINEVAAHATGHTPAQLIGTRPEDNVEPAFAAELRRDMQEALGSPDVTTREYRHHSDGELRVWDARYLPLTAAPGRAPDQLLLVATDVTEQRAAQEARLEAAIAQREMLVKEVHHRIKNNLQGVAGLLQEIARSKPEVADAISEVVGQVQAIAQVYGLQVGSGGALQLVNVVEAITASVQRTFGRPIRFVGAGAASGAWTLPEAEAIPIALTLNELLTNAIKHSTGTPADDVLCTLDAGEMGVRVRISNLATLPEGFSIARIPGGVSGLGLVRALLPRRGARLTLEQAGERVEAALALQAPVVARLDPP